MSNDQPQETRHQSSYSTDAFREKFFLLRSERPDAQAALDEILAEVEHWRQTAEQYSHVVIPRWQARAEAAEAKLDLIRADLEDILGAPNDDPYRDPSLRVMDCGCPFPENDAGLADWEMELIHKCQK